jgi:hypothetical protein
VTSTAGDPTINGNRSRFRFNDVTKGVAARAIEMNGPVFGHDIRAPTHWPEGHHSRPCSARRGNRDFEERPTPE